MGPIDAAAATAPAGETGSGSPSPIVAFIDGRRPEAQVQVTLDAWAGPLGLLLSLIEARQLDVMTVPLGALAGAYLDALAVLEVDRLGNVSAFVGVASQLILIKSRALLPRRAPDPALPGEEAPDPEQELRARLLLYRAYRDAGAVIVATAQERVGLFRREPSSAQAAALAGARPGDLPPLPPSLLGEALRRLIRLVPPVEALPEVMPRTIRIADRAAVIRAALESAPRIVLQELLKDVRDRVVVAITFLAMLELMKRREIVVEQDEPWGPIVARRTTAEERNGAPPGDEPIDETMESFA